MNICHHYTDEAVCPHCGHQHSDTYEWMRDGKDHASVNCEDCGKPFELFAHYTVEYCTEKPRADAQKGTA